MLIFLVGTDRPIGEKRSALYRTADAIEIAVLGAEGWIASLSVTVDSLMTPLDGDVFRAIPEHLRSFFAVY